MTRLALLGTALLLTGCLATADTRRPLYRDSDRANTLAGVDVDPDDILDFRDDDRR